MEDQTNKLHEGRNKLVECSRIANELRIQRMIELNSPQKQSKVLPHTTKNANQDGVNIDL